jgi:glycosyltransferase involved in cell wall biosynthesis
MAKVSIIIPTKKIDFNVDRCVRFCKKQPFVEEIIVVDDSKCPGLPAAKRNWAMQIAKGDIYAFIDSDAYPNKDWLKKAVYWLQCYDAVCGPGVLPPDAPYNETIADWVHRHIFCPYRVFPKHQRIVPWHPTFNLIVKKEVATKFDSYLTGEDDLFCERIKEGVFYHPEIIVYHNRRGIFKPLWKQFATYAKHKGAFNGMAFVAWFSTLGVYIYNFVCGFIRRKP